MSSSGQTPVSVSQKTGPLNLNNIQGDILAGFAKRTETYLFYQIDSVNDFRCRLADLVPLITTTAQLIHDRQQIAKHKKTHTERGKKAPLIPLRGVNVAFSQFGLKKLGINDDIGDSGFKAGQLADAESLGDEGTKKDGKFDPEWEEAFKHEVHFIILVAADSDGTLAKRISEVENILGIGSANAPAHEVLRLSGQVRPGDQKGHEHFGFLDGISNPAVQDFDTNPNPGQETIPQGVILLGRPGDAKQTVRPSWALDGSLLTFRYLPQLVPEFDEFLRENPLPLPGLTPEEGSELLGARLVGRWKSGAPIDLTPLKDDPELGTDPKRNNNFRYDFPNDFLNQDRCPFAAHTRKTNPRNDLEGITIPTAPNRIIRRGIQFGGEVTDEEKAEHKTLHERGLLFVCYQSNLDKGFQFVQKSWANNTGFPLLKTSANNQPGFDPIIGQTNSGGPRSMSGPNPSDAGSTITLPQQWVLSKGGEYFFSPSISTLRDVFAGSPQTQA